MLVLLPIIFNTPETTAYLITNTVHIKDTYTGPGTYVLIVQRLCLHRIARADEFEIYPTVLSTDKSD
jgi:hypothetical protein